jgi:fructose-1-phosphate kinase PfkB-like protein
VLALGFVGGRMGQVLRDCLEKQDVPHLLTPTDAQTRGGFLVLDREKGIITEIPEHAPAYTTDEADKLLESTRRHIGNASILLIADGRTRRTPICSPCHWLAKGARCPRSRGPLRRGDSGGSGGAGVWLLRVNLKSLQKQTERSLQHDSAIIEEAQTFWQAVSRTSS